MGEGGGVYVSSLLGDGGVGSREWSADSVVV